MALVDTQGFATAVDRSLFGPQGRRWVERKLPEVVTNVAFIAVSTFGACVLMLHVSAEYHAVGYWAILHTPKHVINGVVVHLIARALRWHVDRMLGHSFQVEDEGPGFFEASSGGGDDDVGRDRAAPVLWPWQSGGNASTRKARSEVPESPSDDGHSGWRAPGGDADDSAHKNGHHRRSRSADVGEGIAKGVASAALAAASQHGSALGGDGGGGSAVPASPRSRAAGRSGSSEPRGRGEASDDNHRDNLKLENNQPQQQQQHHKNNIHFPNLFAACQPGPQPPSPSHSVSPSPSTRENLPMSAGRSRRDNNNSSSRRSSNSRHGRESRPSKSDKEPNNSHFPPNDSPQRESEGFDGGVGDDADHFDSSNAHDAGVDGDGGGGGGGSSSVYDGGSGGECRRSDAGSTRESRSGWTSDDGGAGGHGTGSRGSRRRLRALTASSPTSPVVASAVEVAGSTAEGEDGAGPHQVVAGVAATAVATAAAAAVAAAAAADKAVGNGGGGGGGGGRTVSRWTSIDKWSRALGTSRRRGSRQQPKMNFFTEDDFDELLHSTFFIKMCDDASWLYVEEQPHHPQLNWLLSFWGGFKVAPRFPGEVTQHEAHRMLFQCENGRHKGHVRIRSRATNTFLFFLGIKHPLTWVAWDRDVVGGDWEDLRLEWVGTPAGPDGVLVGDERGRVIVHCRSLNAYVSWNGTGFTHVQAKEGATVFMLQRMSHSSSSTTSSPATSAMSRRTPGISRRHSTSSGGGVGVGSVKGEKEAR